MILNLQGNVIGDLGSKYIAEGMSRGGVTGNPNQTLKSLDLGLNEITGDGLEVLHQGLKGTGLTHLYLSKNPLKNKVGKYNRYHYFLYRERR